jgi:type IV pilus assembly protein PilB
VEVADASAPIATATRLIGDVAVELGFATREKVERAVALARARGRPTGQTLVEQGVLRHDQLARVVAERYDIPYIDLSLYDVDMDAAGLLDPEAARSYQAVPVGFLSGEEELLLAMADPANAMVLDDIAMITAKKIIPVCASADEIHLLIARLSSKPDPDPQALPDSAEAAEFFTEPLEGEDPSEQTVIDMVLAEALRRGAQSVELANAGGESDTHAVLRIDGTLTRGLTLSAEQTRELFKSVKDMAHIVEDPHRSTREGRFELDLGGRTLQVGALALTLSDGEDLLLKVKDAAKPALALGELGMQPTEQDRFAYALSRPAGMLLIAGPTASGVSSTLYAALAAITDGSRRVITIEERIDVTLAGARQLQLGEEDPAKALRGVLRAEPDIVMLSDVGEPQSARAALDAAISGRLVLAGMHARDATDALMRLADSGVEPHLISAGVDCVVAQRLMRVLCPHCKRPSGAGDSLLTEYGLTDAYEPAGCAHCAATGYRGRTGIYEVMPVTEEIRALILAGSDRGRILELASHNGVRSMREDAVAKARAGITSIAEVERMTAGLL